MSCSYDVSFNGHDGNIKQCCVQILKKSTYHLRLIEKLMSVFKKLIIYGLLYENKGGHEVHDIY